MSELSQLLNGYVSLLCAVLLAYIVLCRHLHEGLVIKTGLILTIVGLFGASFIALKGFDSYGSQWNASLLIYSGLLVTIAGGLLHLNEIKIDK